MDLQVNEQRTEKCDSLMCHRVVHLAMKGPNPKELLKLKGEVVHVGAVLCLVSLQNKF